MSGEVLLDAAAVAARYGVTRWSVYRWVSRGQLRAVKVGGALRFRPEALAAFEQPHEPVARPRRP